MGGGRGVTADLSVGLPWTGGSRGRASTQPLIMSSHYEYYEFSHKRQIFFWMQPVWPHILKHNHFEEAQKYKKESARIPRVFWLWKNLMKGLFPLKWLIQEDMEADYEKLERRSRIRTARARQINPQVMKHHWVGRLWREFTKGRLSAWEWRLWQISRTKLPPHNRWV